MLTKLSQLKAILKKRKIQSLKLFARMNQRKAILKKHKVQIQLSQKRISLLLILALMEMKTILTSQKNTCGAHRNINCHCRSNLDLKSRLLAKSSQYGHEAWPNGTAVIMLCPGLCPQTEAILPSEQNYLAVFQQLSGHRRASTSTWTKDTPCKPKSTLTGPSTQLTEKSMQNVYMMKELFQQKVASDLPFMTEHSIELSIQ